MYRDKVGVRCGDNVGRERLSGEFVSNGGFGCLCFFLNIGVFVRIGMY